MYANNIMKSYVVLHNSRTGQRDQQYTKLSQSKRQTSTSRDIHSRLQWIKMKYIVVMNSEVSRD